MMLLRLDCLAQDNAWISFSNVWLPKEAKSRSTSGPAELFVTVDTEQATGQALLDRYAYIEGDQCSQACGALWEDRSLGAGAVWWQPAPFGPAWI